MIVIELDDFLVSHRDYEDIKEAIDLFLKQYDKKQNDVDDEKQMERNDQPREHNKKLKHQLFGEKRIVRLSKAVKYLSLTIRCVAFTGGLIAPFAIFVCFSN